MESEKKNGTNSSLSDRKVRYLITAMPPCQQKSLLAQTMLRRRRRRLGRHGG